MALIEENWLNYNETQRKMLTYLFLNNVATLAELVEHTQINTNSIRAYLNGFIDNDILERHSSKLRDANATYTFRKD